MPVLSATVNSPPSFSSSPSLFLCLVTCRSCQPFSLPVLPLRSEDSFVKIPAPGVSTLQVVAVLLPIVIATTLVFLINKQRQQQRPQPPPAGAATTLPQPAPIEEQQQQQQQFEEEEKQQQQVQQQPTHEDLKQDLATSSSTPLPDCPPSPPAPLPTEAKKEEEVGQELPLLETPSKEQPGEPDPILAAPIMNPDEVTVAASASSSTSPPSSPPLQSSASSSSSSSAASSSASASPSLPSLSTSSAEAAAAAAAVAALPPNHFALRFLHGEKPILSFLCDVTQSIRKLKAMTFPFLAANNAPNASSAAAPAASAPSSSSPPPSHPPPQVLDPALADSVYPNAKIMWIFQGQLLRDERTLADYKTITNDSIIHVHILPVESEAQQQQMQQQQQQQFQQQQGMGMGMGPPIVLNAANGLRQRVPINNGYPGNQPQQGEYLLPPPFIVQGNGALMRPNPLPVSVWFKAMFALFVCLVGVLWGLVLVFGGKLFSLKALLSLIFLLLRKASSRAV